MLENEPVGTIVGEVFAEDIDTGTFGEIAYSISGLGSEKCVINNIIQNSLTPKNLSILF